MTLATDWVLAVLCFHFASRLGMRPAPQREAVTLWAWAFVATGAAAVLGGAYHGFGPEMPSPAADALWRGAMVCAGATSMFMLCAAVRASCGRPWRTRWLVLAKLKFLAYAALVAWSDDYRFAVYDTIGSMALVLLFQGLEVLRGKLPTLGWMAVAMIISVAAALVQRSIARLGPFNHNDIYHVIQMASLWFFYRAGRGLQDAVD
jgi:hypothetical protein